MRTCVGCRAKAAKSALLRVVVVWDQGTPSLAPDPAGRLPGRGASVHLDPRCVDLAEKRRAFPRALRLGEPLAVAPVREHVAGRLHPTPPSDESGSTA
ncbi:MAG: YlxR family protein [Mycobacteriales bacterium]